MGTLFRAAIYETFDSDAQKDGPFSHIFDFSLQKQLIRKAVQESLVKSLENIKFVR